MSRTTTRRRGVRNPVSPAPPVTAFASADRPLVERVMPLVDLTLVQAGGAAGLTAALLLDRPLAWGVLCGVLVALVLVVPGDGRSLSRRVLARVRFWRDRRRRSTITWAPFDHEQSDAAPIGFSWDGETLTSLIRVVAPPPSLTVLQPGRAVTGDTVPVGVLGECLRQSDITLEAIDVISRGARSAGDGHLADMYEGLLGPLPAIAHRAVWVAVRLDPARCPEAVRARGGGWDAALRTAAVATRRVANRLRDAGQQADTTTASDMLRAVTELTGALDLDSVQESWSACHHGRLELSSSGLEPALCTADGLSSLWTLPSRSTTVTLSLRCHPQREAVEVRGIVRLDSLGRHRGRTAIAGLRHLFGRQHDALVCASPLPAPRRQVGRWLTVPGEGTPALTGLELPASGCGQVVGADDLGHAVAVPLFGPGITRVQVHGTLHLAQQVILRSLALGARVRVHTRRPGAWQEMVDAVGDAGRLHAVSAESIAAERGPRRDYSVEMYDGVSEQSARGGMTVIVVSPTHSPVATAADVRLQLIDVDRDVVRVTTATGSATVTMVASDQEMRFIGSSLDQDRTENRSSDEPRTR
ncbi:type VII secretion protein EccE [Mycolicibacterium tokaiense]|uniref:type VII secretion protein EccE n=1 Tax=Mycolicibacterium tokaiense TaxID=39695 RepID=UPI001E38BD24|nr:type VII secretion protein EccE [Mycolicibacterium tokaiense]